MTSRTVDGNGFVTVAANPVTRAGVFPYLGRSIPGAPEPDKVYMVYRPAEELADPECIASFNNLPITDDHPPALFSADFSPERHNLHGASESDAAFDGVMLRVSLRIFSKILMGMVESGKKALSAGYKCVYEKSSGIFENISYDYVQRRIRANHIALVKEGRAGPEVAVLDSAEAFAFDTFDLGDAKMADEPEDKKTDATEEKAEMTLAEAVALIKEIIPQIKAIQEAMAGKEKEEVAEGEASALDEDKEDGKKKEDEAMDAAEIAALKQKVERIEKRDPVKEALAQLTARDRIATDARRVVGAFDASEMTADEVVAYACDKLDIKGDAAYMRAALDGYVKASAAAASPVTYAMDGGLKKDGLLEKRFNKKLA